MTKYSARVIEEIDNGPGIWNSLKIGVFNELGEEQVGEYIRNYPALLNTFFHFQKNGKGYALYSRDYTATRVMSLPDCKDLGGEEPDAVGFCPVDFYVPWQDQTDPDCATAEFGFVAGCVWGDDTSWKIQFLDLSEAEDGLIKRDARFGYIKLPSGLQLCDAVCIHDFGYGCDDLDLRIEIATARLYYIDGDGAE